MSLNFKVLIYTDYPSKTLSIDLIGDFLSQLGFSIAIRGNIFDFLALKGGQLYGLAERLAGTTVRKITQPLDKLNQACDAQIDSELNRIKDHKGASGLLYEGLWIQRILYELLATRAPEQLGDEFIHIIFTSRLFGTFETKRYHARVLLMGLPCLISTSGLVEAPAKPREYYYIKGGLIHSGVDTRELDELYRGSFLEYDDPKISQITRSYALQAIMHKITGKAFCDDPSCCLFNSHWQEEVLRVQYRARPCDKCFDSIRNCNSF